MRTFAAVSALLLASLPASAGQTRESLRTSGDRIAREIAIVTPAPVQPPDRKEWNKLRHLPDGSPVRVILRDGALKDGHLGYVADDRIVLLTIAALPPDAQRRLLDVATNYPGYIGRERHFRHKGLTVEESGIFVDGTRVADTASVLTEIGYESIAEIQRPVRGSLVGGLLGVAAGGALGLFSAAHLIYKPCGGNCKDEGVLLFGSLIGLPIAGGYIGAKAMPHRDWTAVYRRR